MSKALELLKDLGVEETLAQVVTEVTESQPEPEILEPLTLKQKQKAAAGVAKSLAKQYGGVLLQSFGKRVGQRLPSYPTNLISFDEQLAGCGGVPKGRIIEIFGPEASGKTTIALHVIAEIQKAGGMAAFVDAEHALDPSYADRIGVNVNELLISQPDYGEQALEVVEALVRARAVDVIVVDSVSALVPKAELDGDMGDSHMGLQARLMSQAMRKLAGLCNKNGVTVIFINQVRENLGVMFGNPETTTGGRALKFYASLRIKIRQLSKTDGGIIEDDNKKRIGQRCRLQAVKNKVGGAPYAETDLTLLYGTGWDKASDLLHYAVKIGSVVESKGWYTIVSTEERFREKDLKEEKELIERISKACEEKRRQNQEQIPEDGI